MSAIIIALIRMRRWLSLSLFLEANLELRRWRPMTVDKFIATCSILVAGHRFAEFDKFCALVIGLLERKEARLSSPRIIERPL